MTLFGDPAWNRMQNKCNTYGESSTINKKKLSQGQVTGLYEQCKNIRIWIIDLFTTLHSFDHFYVEKIAVCCIFLYLVNILTSQFQEAIIWIVRNSAFLKRIISISAFYSISWYHSLSTVLKCTYLMLLCERNLLEVVKRITTSCNKKVKGGGRKYKERRAEKVNFIHMDEFNVWYNFILSVQETLANSVH